MVHWIFSLHFNSVGLCSIFHFCKFVLLLSVLLPYFTYMSETIWYLSFFFWPTILAWALQFYLCHKKMWDFILYYAWAVFYSIYTYMYIHNSVHIHTTEDFVWETHLAVLRSLDWTWGGCIQGKSSTYCSISALWISFSIHSPVFGLLGCSWVSAGVHSTAMSIGACIYFWVNVFHIIIRGELWIMQFSFSILKRNVRTVLIEAEPLWLSLNQCLVPPAGNESFFSSGEQPVLWAI